MKIINKNQKEVIKEKDFMTIPEVVEFTGLSKHFWYQMTHRKRIRFYKLNDRRCFFKKQDVLDFIFNEHNLVKSQPEIENQALSKIVTGG